MQHRNPHEQIDISIAIQRLKSNDPAWNVLFLPNIFFYQILSTGHCELLPLTLDDFRDLTQAIMQNTTLQCVYVNNTIGPVMNLVGQSLKDHPCLQIIELEIDQSTLDYHEVIGFLDIVLTGAAPILTLSMGVPGSNARFFSELGRVLYKNKKLKIIELEGSAREEKFYFDQTVIEDFFTGLCFEKSLEIISLNFLPSLNPEDKGIACLSHHLSHITSLNHLQIKSMGLSVNGILALKPIFKANRNLTVLNLTDNPLELSGIAELVALLPHLSDLKTLILNNTKLCVFSIHYFIDEWLRLQLTIKELSLELNNISNISIYRMIEGNPHLKKISLDGTGASDSRIEALGDLLSDTRRCHLEYLSLKHKNPASKKSLKKIEYILKHNPLINVYLSPITESSKKYNLINKGNIHLLHQERQQKCLNQAIEIANASTNYKNGSISKLSVESILLVIVMLHGNTVEGMDVKLCARLILKNFILRRRLITDGSYIPLKRESASDETESRFKIKKPFFHIASAAAIQTPDFALEEKNSGIEKWWNKSLEVNGWTRVVFQTNHHATLFYKEKIDREEEKHNGMEERKNYFHTRKCSLM